MDGLDLGIMLLGLFWGAVAGVFIIAIRRCNERITALRFTSEILMKCIDQLQDKVIAGQPDGVRAVIDELRRLGVVKWMN